MRRSQQEIQQREIIDQIINSSLVCRIAMCAEKTPYVVPVSFGYDGTAIYFHTAHSGKKLDILAQNSQVCFEMEDQVIVKKDPDDPCKWSFSYRSVIGEGLVKELLTLDQKRTGLQQIMKHYSSQDWEFPTNQIDRTRVWIIQIQNLTGKQSLDFVSSKR
jgi:nitroimidazol reductase NimA-like FMN-containing flavoprotein (pyridoxamine 5'-phosphate oxidase superfamily)